MLSLFSKKDKPIHYFGKKNRGRPDLTEITPLLKIHTSEGQGSHTELVFSLHTSWQALNEAN